MAVLKLEQDTEWHWRMVLLSCLDLLSTAGLSHRQGHLLDQETAAPHHLGVYLAVLHPSRRDLGAVKLLQKCFFGSTQWLESVQLPQVRLVCFYRSQG